MRWILILVLTFSVVACADSGDDDTTTTDSRATSTVNVEATETRSAEQTEIAEARSQSASPTSETDDDESTATSEPSEPSATSTPAPATATSAPPTATAPVVSADVQLGKWVNKQAQYGNTVYTMGEVINNGSGDAGEVQVVVTHYDAAGAVVSSGEAYEILNRIPAGGKSPFRVANLETALDSIVETRIQVQFKNYDPDAFMADFYVNDIDVTQVSWTPDRISGEVLNAADEPAEGIQVLIIGYEESGEVFGVYSSYVDLDQVDPGVTAAFSSSFLGLGDSAPATAEAFAYGRSVN